MAARRKPAHPLTPLLCLGLAAFGARSAGAEESEFFEKKIRPVLVEHCYQCHAAGAKELKGGLRLDVKAGWQRGGESGEPAILPGKPDESPLIRAVRHADDVSAMPPGGTRLPPQIIEDLTHWVRIGAPDPRDGTVEGPGAASWQAEFRRRSDWWSLRPVANVAVPDVEDGWSDEPVDRFVLQGLRRRQLQPAADADALTLLRRMSFVLTGLPPAVADVRTFPARFDEDPEAALQALADKLLKSPHFGERIARHWMDVVRYTDTYGYEWDNPAKGSWEYRDYLIRAFNRDVGFDQLVREQIAGDLLATPRVDAENGLQESLIGPMFYHLGEHRHGDNVAINGVREEMIDNKIDAFSKAFLAMTVACARCHDHKLDAISQADYYALAGVFMTPRWTSRSIETADRNKASIVELKRLRDAIQQRLSEVWRRQAADLASGDAVYQWAAANRHTFSSAKPGDLGWLFKDLLGETRWLQVNNLAARAAAKSTELVVEEDGSVLARGDVPQSDTYTLTFKTKPGRASLLRLEALTHASLGKGGPGRTPHGNFVLSHVRVSVKPLPSPLPLNTPSGTPGNIVIAAAHADYSQPNYPVEAALGPAAGKGWGVGLGGNVDRTAWFTFTEPVALPHGGEWTVVLEQRYGDRHSLGRFRITPGFKSALPESSDDSEDQPAAATAETWQRLVKQWQITSEERRAANARTFTPVTDFSQPELPAGWVIDGDGMRTGYVTSGQPLIALDGDSVVERLLPRGYHTHALSSKLPGALRLPPQEALAGKFVSLALAGGQWSGYLRVADNAFQTETVTFLDQPRTAWRQLADAAQPNGIQRIAYEIATSDLNPNFPPRTGLAKAGSATLPDNDEGFDKRSWFSVTGIVSHQQAGKPADDLGRFARLFAEPAPARREAWRRIGSWLADSVAKCGSGRADDDDVTLVNWLISEGLLPNSRSADAELAALVDRYRQVESTLAYPRTVNSMDERDVAPRNYALNIRGDINTRGDVVPRDFLKVFSRWHEVGASPNSGRLQLAEFLADPQHGFTARVYVNRVWQWVFGDALVRTANDFGHLGEQPSHPELLDYLTREFIADGWSTKRLIRRLVLSRTFRQTGAVAPRAAAADPENRLRHHYATRRLEAEAVRDALLSCSGRLDGRLYGRPINPRRRLEDGKKRLFSGPLDGNGRRSVYLEVSIMDRSKFLQSFNAPDPKLPTGRRDATSGPAQALAMLNDPFVVAMAEHWAAQLVQDGAQSVEERIRAMHLRAIGRPPRPEEADRWARFAEGLAAGDGGLLEDRIAWQQVAHTMFNLQEFIHYR